MSLFYILQTERDILRTAINILGEQRKQTALIEAILDELKPQPAVRILFYVEGKETTKMKMTDTQQFTATIAPVGPKNKPAPVQDGSVVWTGPQFVSVTPAADGMSALIVALGQGTGTVTVSADADLGDGVITIGGSLNVIVGPSQATSIGITTSDPVEQPDAPPPPPPPPPTV